MPFLKKAVSPSTHGLDIHFQSLRRSAHAGFPLKSQDDFRAKDLAKGSAVLSRNVRKSLPLHVRQLDLVLRRQASPLPFHVPNLIISGAGNESENQGRIYGLLN
jgi:hypothetical protein